MIDSYTITGILERGDKLIIRVTFLDEKGDKVFRDSIELPKSKYAKNGEIDADKLEKDLDRLIELRIKAVERRITGSALRLIGRRRKIGKNQNTPKEK